MKSHFLKTELNIYTNYYSKHYSCIISVNDSVMQNDNRKSVAQPRDRTEILPKPRDPKHLTRTTIKVGDVARSCFGRLAELPVYKH
jgi:hypothetical protein